MPGTIKKVTTPFGDTYTLKGNLYTYIGEVILVHSNSGYVPDGFKVDIYKNGSIIGTKKFSSTFNTTMNGVSYDDGMTASLYVTEMNGESFGFIFDGTIYPADKPTTQSTTPKSNTVNNTDTITGTTFNSPPTADLEKKKKELKDNVVKLQKIGLPPVAEIGQQLWENMIKPKILTNRQIMKKMLMLQGQAYPEPMTEEDAQFIVYGKVYYKDGKLYDNEIEDPACVSQPTDDDYEPPIDENHPLWKKVVGMLDDIKDSLLQLGIKLGEFLIAQPQAIANMAISLSALASSVVILPFGSGLPTALSAVQTMMKTIKDLQAKTAEILPLLAILDFIALVLPKNAQSIIAQINVIIAIYLGVLTAITAVLGILEKITKALDKFKKKQDNKITAKLIANPNPVTKRSDGTELKVEASGGDWQYTFRWTDQLGNLIPLESGIEPDDDNGTRKVTPQVTTIYTCRIVDGTGTVKEVSIPVIILPFG